MAGASIPPWTTSISSRPPRPFLPKTTFHQVPSPSKDTLPLPPDDSAQPTAQPTIDRKSTRLNSSHVAISYAVFCLKKKKENNEHKHASPVPLLHAIRS